MANTPAVYKSLEEFRAAFLPNANAQAPASIYDSRREGAFLAKAALDEIRRPKAR